MTSDTEFDPIKPYEGDMVPQAAERVKDSSEFKEIFSKLSGLPAASLEGLFKDILTRKDFQNKVWTPITEYILKQSSDGVYIDGIGNMKPDRSYLYISNHRDIILDSAILNRTLQNNRLKTCRNAIGEKLIVNECVTDIIKLASCFIIERKISVRELIKSSMLRSRYMRETINEKEDSIWIAEREGRTKNGDDRCQPALLKMLKMSGHGTIAENLRELNIIITSISYEWEPCDILKVHENYLKRHIGYEKTKDLDFLAMLTGMKDNKGRIHYSFTPITDAVLSRITAIPSRIEQINALATEIDLIMHSTYRLWPNNFIAYDLLKKDSKYADRYSQEEKDAFCTHMQQRIDGVEGDREELGQMFLELYENPVINKENI